VIDLRDSCSPQAYSSAMTFHSHIPPLLTPYILSPHKDSLILLTNTLGTSANWLLLRYLCGVLGEASVDQPTPAQHEKLRARTGQSTAASSSEAAHDSDIEDIAVVLVSWMRDFEFWRTEARRAGVSFCSQIL
jgi:elongator complex protein 6